MCPRHKPGLSLGKTRGRTAAEQVYVSNVYVSPLPKYQLWPFSFPQKIPPKTPKWVPQNEFPGIPRTEGFCGNATENPNFPEFPGPSQFRILGSPFSAFWGKWSWYVGQGWFMCLFCSQFWRRKHPSCDVILFGPKIWLEKHQKRLQHMTSWALEQALLWHFTWCDNI